MYVFNAQDIHNKVVQLFSQDFDFIYSHKKRCYYIKKGSGFDIETSTIKNENGEPVQAFCYHWQFSFGDDVVMGRTLETMTEFFREFSEILKTFEHKNKPVRLLVFDANLGYEWQFCKKHWYKIGLSEFFCKEPRNPLKVTLNECIEMRECLGLFGSSLNDIAKNFCNTKKLKGDLDYSILRNSKTPMTKEEIQYCINDVKILSELGNYVYKNFFGNKADLPLTSTGIIRNAIKKRIKNIERVKEYVIANLPNEKDFIAFRQYLFKGGLCGSNDLFSNMLNFNVICADFTSDYPAILFHCNFPDGKCEETEPEKFREFQHIPYIALIEFTNFESKTTHSIISSHKVLNVDDLVSTRKKQAKYKATFDNGRIYKAEKILLLINDVEFRGIEKSYDFDEFEILRCWKFERYAKAPKYLLDELKIQYRKKSELKKTGKHKMKEYKEEYRQAKVFCNGIYGMCATSIFMDEKKLDETPDCNVEILECAKTFEDATKNMWLSQFIAFWVTSYARNLLIDYISDPVFSEIIIQYDTDSLYFLDGFPESEKLKKAMKEYNRKIEILNNTIFNNDPYFSDLGAWDFETPIFRFKGMGAKRYMKEQASHNDIFKMKFFTNFFSFDFETLQKRQKIDFHKKHLHREIKVVCVGCKDGTFLKQFSDVSHETIFDCFTDGFEISKENSGKLESHYIDDSDIVTVTDSKEQTETIYILSSVVLRPVAYKMGLAQLHIDFIRSIQDSNQNRKKGDKIEVH